MALKIEQGQEILKKYCNPDFEKVKGKKLILALVEVAGCPYEHGLIPKNRKCTNECYECWRLAKNKK